MSMFAICIESSHKKGMGHFFRAMNMFDFFKRNKEDCVLFINNDENALQLLKQKRIAFEVVDLNDLETDWESGLIDKYKVSVWINDRLDTRVEHARNVKKNQIKLISFDDRGKGAEISDINFGSLPCNFNYQLKGKKVFSGIDYLVLDRQIDSFKRVRKKCEKVIVTLGGSDTYGVTAKVVGILKNNKIPATVVTGPGFKHWKELIDVAGKDYDIVKNVPSLIEEFSRFDLAITGGGVTPFEANASGLPCIIVANELEEVDNGVFLEKIGSSVFAGYHEKINKSVFRRKLPIEKMSIAGLVKLSVLGAGNIYRQINSLFVSLAHRRN